MRQPSSKAAPHAFVPFLIDVPLFKVEIWYGKSQNSIRPPQYLLEFLVPVYFDNISPL
jgi:hypothetical protein